MCCTRLAENTGCKKSPEICHLGTIALLCRAVSSQLRHVSTIGKKLVKLQYLLHTSSPLVNLVHWPLTFGRLGHPSNFQQILHLGFVTAVTSLTGGKPNFAWCLAVSWASTPYIHFWGLLPPDGSLPGAKFTLHPSLAFSYIGSVTARHTSSGHQPNFAAWYKEWNYGTFAEGATYIRLIGHHVGHWPTF